MSTKQIRRNSANVTEQSRDSWYNIYTPDFGAAEFGGLYPATFTPAIYQESHKAAEAQRQISRTQVLQHRCDEMENPDAQKRMSASIETCISLLSSFATVPLPIPVASSGRDCGTTLFFQDGNIYGDLEINGKSVEYYVKSTKAGEEDIAYYDTEEIEEGFIPPKLLYHLLSICSG